MLTVMSWRWGGKFAPAYVHRLKAALERHLRLPHTFVCVTDDTRGLEGIRTVPLPELWNDTPRCRRRMRQYDAEFARQLGTRILSIDLDMVVVGDLTPLIDRPEPIVCWKVGYANVYSGSIVLYDFDALHGLFEAFAADPIGYPKMAWPGGIGSDQAMLNYWLRTQGRQIPHWTEADGVITYFGKGYERFAHLGVGPSRPQLPPHARLVVLGSDDKHAMENGDYPWVLEHWGPPLARELSA